MKIRHIINMVVRQAPIVAPITVSLFTPPSVVAVGSLRSCASVLGDCAGGAFDFSLVGVLSTGKQYRHLSM